MDGNWVSCLLERLSFNARSSGKVTISQRSYQGEDRQTARDRRRGQVVTGLGLRKDHTAFGTTVDDDSRIEKFRQRMAKKSECAHETLFQHHVTLDFLWRSEAAGGRTLRLQAIGSVSIVR